MIERLYIDNFRCLVNFEWRPGRVALMLGENGSGKTSIIDVLWALRRIVVEEEEVGVVCSGDTLTRWEKRIDQTFELDIRLGDDLIRYRLVLRHERRGKVRVQEESVSLFAVQVAKFTEGILRFETGAGDPVTLKTRETRSSLPVVTPASDEGPVHALVGFLDELWVVSPDPRAMTGSAEKIEPALDTDCANFAGWWRGASGMNPEGVAGAREDLAQAFGLANIGVPRGSTRLVATLEGEGASYSVDFDELSDGQRQLVVLYTLLRVVAPSASLICFDEPDNYVSLAEIEPWLALMVDAAMPEGGPQVVFVSHHPELLNQLAPDYGTRFFRRGGATRHEPFRGIQGLSSAEVVARGWDEP